MSKSKATNRKSGAAVRSMELLGCPFCGFTAHVIKSKDGHTFVRCLICMAQTFRYEGTEPRHEHAAIEAWNRRQPNGGVELPRPTRLAPTTGSQLNKEKR